MAVNAPTIQSALAVINTAGVVGVLAIAIWLGLRGDVVTGEQLADCRAARDSYLREWVRAVSGPLPTPIPIPPGR